MLTPKPSVLTLVALVFLRVLVGMFLHSLGHNPAASADPPVVTMFAPTSQNSGADRVNPMLVRATPLTQDSRAGGYNFVPRMQAGDLTVKQAMDGYVERLNTLSDLLDAPVPGIPLAQRESVRRYHALSVEAFNEAVGCVQGGNLPRADARFRQSADYLRNAEQLFKKTALVPPIGVLPR